MRNFESVGENNKVKAGAVITAASLMLAGCGIGSGNWKKEGIPGCPEGYESSHVVHNQDAVIAAFEAAGQDLAADYNSKGRSNVFVRIAFRQLFDTSSRGVLIPDNTTSDRLNSDAYRADDPGEIMCQLDQSNGDKVTVLSPVAIQAKTILSKSGNPVHFPHSSVS